ncbi:MAG: hypothetical protein RL490_1479 [Pseudomonadota bacterium]|jgi:uncharacterized membrane protein YhhN
MNGVLQRPEGRKRLASAVPLLLSLLFGLAYPLVDARLPGFAAIIAKGAGVGLLALAAALARHWWLAAIMACGAVGDVLLELPGLFLIGAGAFAIGHGIAMVFYARQRRAGLVTLDRVAATALIGFGLAMPALVMPAGASIGPLMLYAVLLCGMAVAALLSRFAPYGTGLGALLFVISDTLIFIRMGGAFVGSPLIHGLIIWYSYYLGQALIFAGVMARR